MQRNLARVVLLLLSACGTNAGPSPAQDAQLHPDDTVDGGEVAGGEAGMRDAGMRPASAVVGAAGGTIAGPNGAKVVIPPGALASDTTIEIAQTSAGAPALPGGVAPFGAMFAFTPHGIRFALPVTVTVPFDAEMVAAAGATPALYKTNAEHEWEQLADVTLEASSLSARVTSFSYLIDAGDPGLLRGAPFREWQLTLTTLEGVDTFDEPGPTVIGGDLHEELAFGTNPVFDIDHDGVTSLEVSSNADGTDFWASADAPSGSPTNRASFVSGRALLTQSQSFVKVEENATLQLVITDALLEAVDFNGEALRSECATGFNSLTAVLTNECDLLRAEIRFRVLAYDEDGPLIVNEAACARSPFTCQAALFASSFARLAGHAGRWRHVLGGYGSSTPPAPRGVWDTRHFDFTENASSTGAQHPRFSLRGPVTIEADLSSVEVGEEFWVDSLVDAFASNRRGRESAIGAYLRDPAKLHGATINASGLQPTHRPPPPPPPAAEALPVPCTTGVDPAAGVLQLGAASYALVEEPFGGMSGIEITRTGGSTGTVSVAFTTSGGSATPGVHYTPLTTTVYFPDGDATPRFLDLEILLNDSAEPDTTVTLTLSEPGGCAALGPQASAELTILDDDRPLPSEPALTIGGTVTGLVGTGLVLHEATNGESLSPGNGPFTFSRPRSSAVPEYRVEVQAHPTNPAQVCTVSRGSGTLAGASVTDVAVDCATQAADGALDASFGSEGKVTTAFGGDETAMALQTDGKIIMAGGSGGDFVLARYDADGSLDPSFGSAGLVTTDFGGPTNEEAHAVALQADGKIVVTGFTVHGTTPRGLSNFDFTLARYESNGSLDADFGTGGIVTTDFNGGADQAFAVAVQPDGRIVVAGSVGFELPTGVAGIDFGLARYESDGRPDDSFGSGGKVTTDIAGGSEFARAIALQQPEGTILVSGRATTAGSSVIAHTALARYTSSGALDGRFGVAGTLMLIGMRLEPGLALQSDGKILLAGSARAVASDRFNQFALMRLASNGDRDASFGTEGLVTTAFSAFDDIGAAVAQLRDGRIIVAGRTGEGSPAQDTDFGVACYDETGALAESFGSGGKLTIDFFASFDGAESVVQQPDGKLLLTGFARNATRTGYGLARLSP